MEDIQIVSEFKERVRETFPEAQVYFYGSRASRTHGADSDYDLLVVLKEANSHNRDTIYDIAWEVGFKYDAFLSPVLTDKKEMKALRGSPFFKNVKQTGIIL